MPPNKSKAAATEAESPPPTHQQIADHVALGLGKEEVPLRPQKPTPESVANGTACSVLQYVKNLYPYILSMLSYELAKTPGVMLPQPLYKQEPPKTEDKDLAITSYKEKV